MSKKKATGKNKKLNLLERLIRDPGEATPEQQILLDTLIKESGGSKFYKENNGKYVLKTASEMESKKSKKTQGRKTKDSESGSSKGLVNGHHEIPTSNGHEKRRPASASSGDSFWSAGPGHGTNLRSRSGSRSRSRSKSRSRSRSNSESKSRSSSRSRSNSRSRSRSDSRSRSRSVSSRSSRSRSVSRSSSDSRSRCRSGSISASSRSRSRSNSAEPTSHSTVQSVPVVKKSFKVKKVVRDTASDQGDVRRKKPPTGSRGRKLLKRGKMRNNRSLDIDPNVLIEERLRQKYRELDEIMRGETVRTQMITRQHLGQMQTLQEQYHMVSHGLAPLGVLIPRSLPSSARQRRLHSAGRHRRASGDTDSYTSEFSNDLAYGALHEVITVTRAREQNIHVPDLNLRRKKKKKVKKRRDSDSTFENVKDLEVPSQVSSMGSRGSPRSMAGMVRTDNHVKDSGNPKLLRWLKEKDKEHRRKAKEEKKKKKEEREKLVLEANEKFEKRLEAQKIYKKWVDEKNKEIRKKEKQERKERKKTEWLEQERQKNTEISIRPKSAPMNRRDPGGGIKVEGTAETNVNISTPHPPSSKFIYKRPVAGRIKLKISDKSESKPRPQSAHATMEDTVQRQRMSYDDWISRKRREDQKKKALIEQRRHEEMSKSDPDMNRLIPEIAKKRIHNVLEGKKRIDTGVKRIDDEANSSFGGADFGKDDPDNQQGRYSYRLPDSSRSATSTDSVRAAKPPMVRPKTAPHGGSRVIPPKQSSGSPRKAVAPAKVEDIMSNEDTSNPFRVPFPEQQGVPKHVAAKQRQLFAENVWQKIEKEERPEPQGSDAQEPPTCVSTDNKSRTANNKLPSGNKSDVKREETDDRSKTTHQRTTAETEAEVADDNINDSKVFLTQFSSVDNLNIVSETRTEQQEAPIPAQNQSKTDNLNECHKQEIKSDNASSYSPEVRNDIDEISEEIEQSEMKKEDANETFERREEEVEKLDAELKESKSEKKEETVEETLAKNVESKVESGETDAVSQMGEVIEENIYEKLPEGQLNPDESDYEDEKFDDDEQDDELRPESAAATSRSSKRVSFREDPEVFQPEPEDGSTDTQTPDNEDLVKFFESGVDVTGSLDATESKTRDDSDEEKIESAANNEDYDDGDDDF